MGVRKYRNRWVADYRDPWQPWLREAQRPTILGLVDGALERHVARRASIVTAVNEPVASVCGRHLTLKTSG